MSKSWYKETMEEARESYLDSDDSDNVVTAIASPIYPTASVKEVRRIGNSKEFVDQAVFNDFKLKFPYSQLVSGNGACYFNASFAAILHDCVGNAEKWKKFRQGLENLFQETSFQEDYKIADFIAQVDEGKEFPTREKVNEVLGVIGDDNIVTKISKTLLVDLYGKQFIDSSKEFLVGEAANYDLKWNGTSDGGHKQRWNDLIDEYVNLRGRDESTFTKVGERQGLTKDLDVKKNVLVKEIVNNSDSLVDFCNNVVETNLEYLEYSSQNLRLYQTAYDTKTLAETYDGNQMKPFFDMLYPGAEIVAITNNGMERSMKDGHPKADTIYLYNPDGRSHFSVLHADSDGRIADDIDCHETVVLPRNPYVNDGAAAPLTLLNLDSFSFNSEQVKAAVINSRINEANEDEDPVAYAIDNFDSEVIWDLAFERASNHSNFKNTHIRAIYQRISELKKYKNNNYTEEEIKSLQTLVAYMFQSNASLGLKSLQMSAYLRDLSELTPETDLVQVLSVISQETPTKFPECNDASVSIYAPKWVEGTLGKLSDKIRAVYPEGININFAETDQNPKHTINLGYPLTLQSLQMLARNEHFNNTGDINKAIYGDLDPGIIKNLKDLVRQVVIIGKDKATGYFDKDFSSYKDFSSHEDFKNDKGEKIQKDVYVIDLPRMGFEESDYASRLFFHSKNLNQESSLFSQVDEIEKEIFKNVTGKDFAGKRPSEIENNPSYIDIENDWFFDKEAYQAFVKEDFVFAANSLAEKLKEADEKRPVIFKFFKNASLNAELTKQFVIGALQGVNEFLDQRESSDAGSPLRKIEAIALPFCKIKNNYIGDEHKDASSETIKHLFNQVEQHIEKQKMNFFSYEIDPLVPFINDKDGEDVEFVTATTNCASPHVTMGNGIDVLETFDARIAQNLVGKGRTFSPYLNDKMKEKYLEKTSSRAATPTDNELSEDQKKYKELKGKLIKFFDEGQLGVKGDQFYQYVGKDGKIVTYNIDANNDQSLKESNKYGLITKEVGGAKPLELSLKYLEEELKVLAKVIAEKATANPVTKTVTSKPISKKSSNQFSDERTESRKKVVDRKIDENSMNDLIEMDKRDTKFLVKEGGDGKPISAKEAAKDKLRDFASKRVKYNKGTDQEVFLDELAKYSAIGVAVKAFKASFNDAFEKQDGKKEIDQKAFLPKDHQRHMRISFKGVDFGKAFLNSFANCEFDGGCDFSKIAKNKNKFANCTFGKECTPQQAKELAKLGPDNLYGCKFSEEFIKKLGTAEQQKFKDALKISGDLVDGFYKSADKKPDSKFEPIAAFKIYDKKMERGQ